MAISLQSIFTLVVVDKNGLDLVESKQVSEQIIEANIYTYILICASSFLELKQSL